MNILEENERREAAQSKHIEAYTLMLHSIQDRLESDVETDYTEKVQESRVNLILKNLEEQNDLIPFINDYMNSTAVISHREFTQIEEFIATLRMLNMRAPEELNYIVKLYLLQRISVKELFTIITNEPLFSLKESIKILEKNNFENSEMPYTWAKELYLN